MTKSKKKKDIVHKDLLIRVLEYCYPKGKFNMKEIKRDLFLSHEELTYIQRYAISSSSYSSKQLFERLDEVSPKMKEK